MKYIETNPDFLYVILHEQSHGYEFLLKRPSASVKLKKKKGKEGNKKSLFHVFQSGFRPKHSCQTALTKMMDTWLSAINDRKIIGVILM